MSRIKLLRRNNQVVSKVRYQQLQGLLLLLMSLTPARLLPKIERRKQVRALWLLLLASHPRYPKLKSRKRRKSRRRRRSQVRIAIRMNQKTWQTMMKRIGFSRCLLASSIKSLMRLRRAQVRSNQRTVITLKISSSSINSLE